VNRYLLCTVGYPSWTGEVKILYTHRTPSIPGWDQQFPLPVKSVFLVAVPFRAGKKLFCTGKESLPTLALPKAGISLQCWNTFPALRGKATTTQRQAFPYSAGTYSL